MKEFKYIHDVTAAVVDHIHDCIAAEDFADREALAEYLNDELWTDDAVTGNASGSHTFNRCKAREYVLADFETVCDALREFCVEADEIGRRFLSEDWEWLDVTARCYVLSMAIENALDELAGELAFAS